MKQLFLEFTLFQFQRGSRIRIGCDFKCNSYPKKNTIGLIEPVVVKTNRRDLLLTTGNHVFMSANCLPKIVLNRLRVLMV